MRPPRRPTEPPALSSLLALRQLAQNGHLRTAHPTEGMNVDTLVEALSSCEVFQVPGVWVQSLRQGLVQRLHGLDRPTADHGLLLQALANHLPFPTEAPFPRCWIGADVGVPLPEAEWAWWTSADRAIRARKLVWVGTLVDLERGFLYSCVLIGYQDARRDELGLSIANIAENRQWLNVQTKEPWLVQRLIEALQAARRTKKETPAWMRPRGASSSSSSTTLAPPPAWHFVDLDGPALAHATRPIAPPPPPPPLRDSAAPSSPSSRAPLSIPVAVRRHDRILLERHVETWTSARIDQFADEGWTFYPGGTFPPVLVEALAVRGRPVDGPLEDEIVAVRVVPVREHRRGPRDGPETTPVYRYHGSP